MERQFSLVNSISVYSIDGHFVRSITSCIVSVFSIITVLNRIIYLILLLQYESKFCYNISIYFHNIFVNIFNVFFFIEEVKSRSATSGKKIHFNNLYSFLCLSYKLLNGKLFRYPNFHIHCKQIYRTVGNANYISIRYNSQPVKGNEVNSVHGSAGFLCTFDANIVSETYVMFCRV